MCKNLAAWGLQSYLHMNRPSKYEVKLFNEILTTLEYRQLVNVPTHRLGNTLDLLIVKESDDLVIEWDVNPIFYSLRSFSS